MEQETNPFQGLVARVRYLMEDAGSAIEDLKSRQGDLLEQLQTAQKTIRGRDQKINKLVAQLEQLDQQRIALEEERENLTGLLDVRQNQLNQVNKMVDKFVGQLQQEVQTLPQLPQIVSDYGTGDMAPMGDATFAPVNPGIRRPMPAMPPNGGFDPNLQSLETQLGRFGQQIQSARPAQGQQRALIMAPRRR